MSVMKMQSRLALVTTILLLTAIFSVLLSNRRRSFNVAPRILGNNPNRFFLFATNSASEYHFIYDPLAADNWLRESCGLESNLPFGHPDIR